MPNYIAVSMMEEKKFRDSLTRCVEDGLVMLVEGIQNEVDPILDPLLEKNLIKKGSKLKVSLGG